MRRSLILFLLLGGCTYWPPPGAGGMAEVRPLPPRTATENPILRQRLDCGLARMDAVADAAAASQTLAGRVSLARQTAARAQREYLGGLPLDSAQTLERLEVELLIIRQDLPPGILPATALPVCA